MLLWTEGQQYTRTELVKMMEEAGFVNVQSIAVFSHWHIIYGFKPEVS